MKQCPNCKSTYPGHQAFCTNCGTALVEADLPPQPAPESPTIQIPPVQQPASAPVGDPFATAPVPPQVQAPAPAQAKKPAGPAVVLAVILAVCTVLAAGCAGFLGYQALQLKKSYESEQRLRISAEQEASSIQEELDRLQLDHDQTVSALEDANVQLEDTRSQLEDVSGQLTSGSSLLDAAERELVDLIDLLDSGYGFASTNYYASKGVVVVRQQGNETISIYENYAEENTYTFHVPNSGVSCQWNGSFTNGTTTLTITGNTPGYYPVSFTNKIDSASFEVLVIVTE